ncbi:hypothetical protein FNF28_06929 [Cafeteria roenbergensis]|uniref:Uncharacterized protein n=1 Tax=Cafeteria roenbergensis TaxID=33653 RepID=A0A5A8CKF2_CAFRO|nr:hypothetical protein FNF28_06929 [Cafeteria roenbergensis]
MEGCGASVEAVRVDGGDLARVSAVLPAHLAPRLASFALQLLASDAGTEGAPIAIDRVGDASLYGVLPSVRDAVQLLGAGRALRFRGEMPGWAAQQLTAIAAGRLDALVTAEKQLVDASLDLFTGDSAADGSE